MNTTSSAVKREHFAQEERTFHPIVYVTSIVIYMFSIYVYWRCNGPEFNLWQFICAIFFAPFYLLYKMVTSGLCGLL